ncbi:MAG: hypothetical protein A2142_07970 [candidate division Zixibacteria bacterium RBG_16_48_11]|nr:MAG: hypothetical protein A2142_07970 [candidate division Zixibacteria bacterium RBG_16_48_11]
MSHTEIGQFSHRLSQVTVREFKRAILLIFLSGLALRALWVYVIPVWQQADEYPHFYYIEYLHKFKAFPVSKPAFPYYEGYQPPMYYILAAGIYSLFPSLNGESRTLTENSEADFHSESFQDNNQMAGVLRWLSVLLWIGTFWVAYLFLTRFIPDDKNVAVVSLSLIAFIPTLVSNTASITNDSLAMFLSTLFFFLMLSERIHKPTQLFLVGLILGWGILSKYNCLVLVPTLIFSLILFHQKSWGKLVFPVLAVTALMVAPWFRFTSQTYGELLALNPGFELKSSLLNHSLVEYIIAGRNLFWSFWAAAGRAYEIHLPIWFYIFVFGGISLISIFGLTRFFQSVKRSSSPNPFQFNLVVLSVFNFILLILASLWYSLSYPIMTSWGKNLFISILPIALLLALGWNQISSRRIWILSLPILLFISDLVYLFGQIRPYFYG